MNKNNLFNSLVIWGIMSFFLVVLMIKIVPNGPDLVKTIPFNQFIEMVKTERIESVTFSGSEITGETKATEKEKSERFKTFGDTRSDYFLEVLGKNNITPNYTPEDASTSIWIAVISNLLPLIFFVAIFWFIFRAIRKNQSGISNFGKISVANIQNNTRTKFADVAGMDEAKEELTEIVDFLKNPSKYTEMGGKIPKGALLIGPPGTGKTLIAKATANEAGVPFLSLSGSDFIEMFVGVGASRVRDLFEQARKNAPAIIFIDEIDAVAKQRSGSQTGSNSEMDQTLNQLLVEMDGIDERNKQIIVLAATNRPDILDKALLRPGRFDRRVHIPLPDIKGREQILLTHAKGKKIGQDVNFEILAKNTAGMAGADLENLLNEAAIMSARKNKTEIDMAIIEEAKDKILMGTERRSMVVNQDEKKKTAYHEAGHALVSKILKLHTVHKVTIVPRGRALGVTQITPDDDQVSFTKDKALNYICMLMGGRAAEDLVFNEFTTGASDDIRRATDIARKMVSEWGMSDHFGPINLSQQGSTFEGETVSPEVRKMIDIEVNDILKKMYQRTKDLLSDNREILDKISTLLVEKETISGEDIKSLM